MGNIADTFAQLMQIYFTIKNYGPSAIIAAARSSFLS